MIAFGSSLVDRLRAAALGPAGLALLAWTVLALAVLPLIDQAALSAGPRATTDFGLLGLRLACAAAAFGLGATALGPPLRRGEVDLWRASGVPVETWSGARILADGLLVLAILGGGLGALTGLVAALGHAGPPHLGVWLLHALLEGLVIYGLVAFTSTALRGAVGPLAAGCWLLLGRIAGATSEGTIGSVLGLLAPDLAALDAQAAVLGAAPPPDLLPALAYGGAWALAACLGAIAWSAHLARR